MISAITPISQKKKPIKKTYLSYLASLDYHEKLRTILDNRSKLKKMNNSPTNILKTQVNKLITANSAQIGNYQLPKIISEYKPGYLYGMIKIHKPINQTLRYNRLPPQSIP